MSQGVVILLLFLIWLSLTDRQPAGLPSVELDRWPKEKPPKWTLPFVYLGAFLIIIIPGAAMLVAYSWIAGGILHAVGLR
jgi:hypothetical protein